MNTARTNLIPVFGLLLALAVFTVASPALAQGDSASATGTAKAKLIAPLTLSASNDLDFGVLIKNFTAGSESVTLQPGFFEEGIPAGTITSSDNSKLIIFGGHEDGDFFLTGEPGYTIQVSAPSSVELSKDGVASPTAQQKLGLSDFLFRVNRSTTPQTLANGGTFVLEPDGATDVDSGGTLTVEGDDETGAYTGSYTVTASYQ